MKTEEQLHSMVNFLTGRGASYSEALLEITPVLKAIKIDADPERLYQYFQNMLISQEKPDVEGTLKNAKEFLTSLKAAAAEIDGAE